MKEEQAGLMPIRLGIGDCSDGEGWELVTSDTRGCLGNEQEDLEVCVLLQGYYLTGITDLWWDSSHDRSGAMDGYRLFRKDRTVW